MRNLQRSLSILGGFAGASLMASALIVGCSGDDVNPADGGKDSATDTSVADTGADAPDSGLTDGPPGADGGTIETFQPPSHHQSAPAVADHIHLGFAVVKKPCQIKRIQNRTDRNGRMVKGQHLVVMTRNGCEEGFSCGCGVQLADVIVSGAEGSMHQQQNPLASGWTVHRLE